MPRVPVPCEDCRRPINGGRKRCFNCHVEYRRKTAAERREVLFQSFEPQAIPIDSNPTPEGRPWNDPRNNWRLPNWNAEQTIRDPLSSPIRICVFDLETTSLDASFGRMLCAVFQFFAPNERIVLRADEYEPWKAGRRADDKAITSDVMKHLESADVLVAHNGVRFDLRFLRTRAVINGLPPVEPRMIVDPVWIARKQFKFHSNSLDSLSTTIGTASRKTPLEPGVWIEAYGNGSTAAMNEVVDHCIKDVETLCETARRFQPYVKQIDVLGSFRQ